MQVQLQYLEMISYVVVSRTCIYLIVMQTSLVNQKNFFRYTMLFILVILVIILCYSAACYMIRRTGNGPLNASSTSDWQLGTPYSEVVQATSGFFEENLVGSGSFGSVYKGVLYGDGTVVAVKVINLQHHGASKSFMDEIKALREKQGPQR
ncbi:hypothetical protein RJ639_021799 [Escallonia herrerae]|uniref:Protein kinase domain-containing protein n=1 Tax=Escallonia herrerae TaxID=1293975 RepID=A0AA88V848_9ASTE|nr:hypothetical protein RJ639_021799 [Escallonia herrerae]